ncbi:ankyrin repeat protein [Magpiepox virus]|nr:ankyrin repeat protein [Magpiepox virus]
MVKILLESGSGVNFVNLKSYTPLTKCLEVYEHFSLMEVIIARLAILSYYAYRITDKHIFNINMNYINSIPVLKKRTFQYTDTI